MNSLRVFIILSVQNQTSFTIYNASAGSGKTYTLVKQYLKILFRSESLLQFRSVLALTFTNKAVGEMKERVIDSLKAFADPAVLEHPNAMFKDLSEELEIGYEGLHKKSRLLLHTIVHNYAAFDISTIDKFNHKIIRTFARDLDIPVNFEVELDTSTVLSKAVDQLVDNAGEDRELTALLVDFAIDKTNEDKSWDVTIDLNTIAGLLIRENDLKFIQELKGKTIKDFKTLKSALHSRHNELTTQIKDLSQDILKLLEEQHIEHSDFSGSYLPKYFIKLSEADFNVTFETAWQNNLLEGGPIYPKKTTEIIGASIEAIRPQLIAAFDQTKKGIFQLKFLKNAINNIVPLSVLSSIQLTLEQLKKEDEFLLISEFNSIIQKEISAQPTPFIYERIGEKFRHYFIDEFQDTSRLQWENLIPLIANTISGETLSGQSGSVMLVGDAKQAIYRWRGGYAEQFIDLYSKRSKPFFSEQLIVELPKNYRSCKAIVDFNNSFFGHIAKMEGVFTAQDHISIYENAKQESTIDAQGFVDISFLDPGPDDDETQLQCESVLQKINASLQNGFLYNDICIIVRRKKEGVAISEFLKDHKIPVLSSETLLLQNSPEVNFIINTLKLIDQPNNDEVKVAVLHYLGSNKLKLEDLHEFYMSFLSIPTHRMFDALKSYDFEFDLRSFLQLPIYESVEAIVRSFQLNKESNAYLQFFLDEVFDFSQKNYSNLSHFLEFWERKKESLSIASPQGDNAVQIMTIHKSKGLEFPVVIFPFANQDLYHDLRPKIWFPVDPDQFFGFNHLYLNLNSDLQYYNPVGKTLYDSYRSALELDSINLLYVVLTRAAEQLYIISKFDVDKSGNEKPRYYSGLLMNYLKAQGLWKEGTFNYHFGESKRATVKSPVQTTIIHQEDLISIAKEAHNLDIITSSAFLWDTHQEHAIQKGNLIHNIMAKIESANDVEFALDSFFTDGIIDSNQQKVLNSTIHQLIDHPKLKPHYKPGLKVLNERDIISRSGKIVRPDRLILREAKDITLIDYKTGAPTSRHEEQLFDYQKVIEEMGYSVTKKILVYVDQEIMVKEF